MYDPIFFISEKMGLQNAAASCVVAEVCHYLICSACIGDYVADGNEFMDIAYSYQGLGFGSF